MIEAQFLLRNCGLHCTILLKYSKNFQWPSILLLTAKLRDKTAPWRPIFGPLLTLSKTIGLGFYLWLNLPIIMQKMLELATLFSS